MAEVPSDFEWPVPWEPVEGERNGPLQHASYALVRAFMAVFGKLPAGGVRLSLGALARLARRVDPSRTRAAMDRLTFLVMALGIQG